MIEQSIRPIYQRMLVNGPAQWLSPYVKANQISVFSGLLGLVVLLFMLLGWVLVAVVFLLLSGYCDTLDGTLARLTHNSSNWGSVLDIVMDRVVEFSVVLGLWAVEPQARSFLCLMMLGAMLLCITSFLVVGIFSENQSNKSFHYSPGLMERAEAFIFFIIMMLWPSSFVWMATIFCGLVSWTTVVRLREFYIQNNAV